MLKTKKSHKDPCPVCDKELYHDSNYSKRIGIMDKGTVEGWMCPYCNAQFDFDDNIQYISGQEFNQGKA